MSDEPKTAGYQVVARRYRPQLFEDVVGQSHVVKSLTNAIVGHRVAHAYLFAGARGVGKTSTARILAKALNCQQGMSPTPCNVCPTCRSIATGDDVDVLEIDGASNRGIDEMRSLRQNAGVRPIQSRFKIYIIDEVHMLTREAFNALLKTLEEPPEHVKFIFCTTEAEKIPITILSRCQRFDFASIDSENITARLQHIAAQEGYTLDDAAATALARRAGGSMRDSQSLLEQLLAFGNTAISAADVHAMLGTADEARITALVGSLLDHDAAAVLAHVDAAVASGVDLGQLLDQVLGYLRDLMVVSAGGAAELIRFVDASGFDALNQQAQQVGLETVLAIMQILAETKSRLRYSTQTRILAELALVRACQLNHLEELGQVIAALRNQTDGESPPPGALKKKPPLAVSPPAEAVRSPRPAASQPVAPTAPPEELSSQPMVPDSPTPQVSESPRTDLESSAKSEATQAADASDSAAAEAMETPPAPRDPVPLTEDSVEEVWRLAVAAAGDILGPYLSFVSRAAILGPNRLALSFPTQYTFHRKYCERPERLAEIETCLAEVTGQEIRVSLCEDERAKEVEATPEPSAAPEAVSSPVEEAPQRLSGSQLEAEIERRPLVKRAEELFSARVVRFDPPSEVPSDS